jgi:predicted 3-demethylubiquinone-9 3-methyltransferase (glyoxalase superfamily)
MMPKITPFLWFDDNAGEAIDFYLSVFKNAKAIDVARDRPEAPGSEGRIMSGTFEIEGQRLHAFNGGPLFTFSPAISLFVNCETQDELDDLWEKLSEGGEQQRCGWLKDKFGVSWQIIPSALSKGLQDKDPEKSRRVMQAMLGMKKIDIAGIEQAYRG